MVSEHIERSIKLHGKRIDAEVSDLPVKSASFGSPFIGSGQSLNRLYGAMRLCPMLSVAATL